MSDGGFCSCIQLPIHCITISMLLVWDFAVWHSYQYIVLQLLCEWWGILHLVPAINTLYYNYSVSGGGFCRWTQLPTHCITITLWVVDEGFCSWAQLPIYCIIIALWVMGILQLGSATNILYYNCSVSDGGFFSWAQLPIHCITIITICDLFLPKWQLFEIQQWTMFS